MIIIGLKQNYNLKLHSVDFKDAMKGCQIFSGKILHAPVDEYKAKFMQMVMPLFANYRDYSSFGIIMAKYAEFDVPNINSTGSKFRNAATTP